MLSPNCFPSFPFLEWGERCRIVGLERDRFLSHELSRRKVRSQTKASPSLPGTLDPATVMAASLNPSCPLMCTGHILEAAAGGSEMLRP